MLGPVHKLRYRESRWEIPPSDYRNTWGAGVSSQINTVLHRGGPANDCGVKMKTRVHRDGIAK